MHDYKIITTNTSIIKFLFIELMDNVDMMKQNKMLNTTRNLEK
jgi:hypothetical protein